MKIIPLILVMCIAGCAVGTVQNSKALYIHAQEAADAGRDAEAIVYWKKLVEQTSKEINGGKYLSTNRFLRASAYFELKNWEAGFADLKELHPGELREEELWIYPLYAVLMGDYYSQQGMTSVGENFYQSVLNRSTLKSSPVYLLALERHINNMVKATEARASGRPDAEKIRFAGFEDLRKEAAKYVEDFPFSGVSHFLLADLLIKTGRVDESMEQFLASVEMGLPSSDLQQSAEFQIANSISANSLSPAIKTVVLRRASHLWNKPAAPSLLQAGENTVETILQQNSVDVPEEIRGEPQSRIRYLAVSQEGKYKIVLWEKL